MATHSRILAWKIPWTETVLNINISNCNKTFQGDSYKTLNNGYFKIFIYLFLAVLAWLLHGLFSSCREQGLLPSCSVWASLVAEHTLGHSVLRSCSARTHCWVLSSPAPGLSSSAACGVCLDQGSNLCLLLWQMDSLPLRNQGSLIMAIFEEQKEN